MKQDIYPSYQEINVVINDGTTFKTRTTWGKPGDTMQLDIDPLSHPAWTGANQKILDTAGQISKFSKRFGDIGLKK